MEAFCVSILCPKRLNSANSVYKYIFVDIYTHILTYIHIWTYIKYYIIRVYCTRLRSVDYHYLFTAAMTVTSKIPMLVYDWPFLDQFSGSGLMEMFLWSVGSFHVFGEKLDFCLQNVTKNSPRVDFPLFKFMYRCKVPSSARWSKAFIFLRKALIFWRLPLWRYGGLDCANGANKVA